MTTVLVLNYLHYIHKLVDKNVTLKNYKYLYQLCNYNYTTVKIDVCRGKF